MIEIRHLKKQMRYSTPLKDINVTVNKGDVISIIGPSGTGKTTLLRCICALEKPTSGEIIIGNTDIADKKIRPESLKNIGMVFQGFNLYPHLNVLENVMVPQIHVLKRTKQEAYDIAIEQLKQVGMFEKTKNYPDELSGGQKQRVAIARTLAMDTDIILFDEPTSALDPAMVKEMEYVIHKLAAMGKTMMIVTHEMSFAEKVSNRILFLCDGIVYEEGTPEEIFGHPKKEKTIDFINRNTRTEIMIDSPYFDFPDVVRKLEMFAEKTHMGNKTANTLQLIFEETIMQMLLPALKNDVKIKVLASFSEKTNEAGLSVYSNCNEKILSNKSISLSLIEAMTKEHTEELTENNEYPHHIRMVF